MATLFKTIFTRKNNHLQSPSYNLKTSSYDSAPTLEQPIKVAYALPGNGPLTLDDYIHQNTRGGDSTTSTTPSPLPPSTKDTSISNSRSRSLYGASRPTTSPQASPAITYPNLEDYERTKSGFSSIISPPNFSRKHSTNTAEPLSPPSTIGGGGGGRLNGTVSPTSTADLRSPDTIVSREEQRRALAASPAESGHSRGSSVYVDLLEAASLINPLENSPTERRKASGKRDYGEDVADRNIADFGGEEFAHSETIYGGGGGTRVKKRGLYGVSGEPEGHKRENSALEHLNLVGESERESPSDEGMGRLGSMISTESAYGWSQHSRNSSNQTVTRPHVISPRTSSLTSAVVGRFPTKGGGLELPVTVPREPNGGLDLGNLFPAVPSQGASNQTAYSSMTANQNSNSPREIKSPQTDQPYQNHYSRPTTSSASTSPTIPGVVKSTPFTLTTLINPLKSSIPTRGQLREPPVVPPPPQRTRALSQPAKFIQIPTDIPTAPLPPPPLPISVTAPKSKVSEPEKHCSTAPSLPLPLPIASRFARHGQSVLPTPPMSPIPDLSPTIPSHRRTTISNFATHTPSRRPSRSQSITYSAFPSQTTTSRRHSRRGSRASVTPTSDGEVAGFGTGVAGSPEKSVVRIASVKSGVVGPMSSSNGGGVGSGGHRPRHERLESSHGEISSSLTSYALASRRAASASISSISLSQPSSRPSSSHNQTSSFLRGFISRRSSISKSHSKTASSSSQTTIRNPPPEPLQLQYIHTDYRPMTAPSSSATPPPVAYAPRKAWDGKGKENSSGHSRNLTAASARSVSSVSTIKAGKHRPGPLNLGSSNFGSGNNGESAQSQMRSRSASASAARSSLKNGGAISHPMPMPAMKRPPLPNARHSSGVSMSTTSSSNGVGGGMGADDMRRRDIYFPSASSAAREEEAKKRQGGYISAPPLSPLGRNPVVGTFPGVPSASASASSRKEENGRGSATGGGGAGRKGGSRKESLTDAGGRNRGYDLDRDFEDGDGGGDDGEVRYTSSAGFKNRMNWGGSGNGYGNGNGNGNGRSKTALVKNYVDVDGSDASNFSGEHDGGDEMEEGEEVGVRGGGKNGNGTHGGGGGGGGKGGNGGGRKRSVAFEKDVKKGGRDRNRDRNRHQGGGDEEEEEEEKEKEWKRISTSASETMESESSSLLFQEGRGGFEGGLPGIGGGFH